MVTLNSYNNVIIAAILAQQASARAVQHRAKPVVLLNHGAEVQPSATDLHSKSVSAAVEGGNGQHVFLPRDHLEYHELVGRALRKRSEEEDDDDEEEEEKPKPKPKPKPKGKPSKNDKVSASEYKIDVPVKGPVPEWEQHYDKDDRPLVYEVDVDEVKNMVDMYLEMGREKMAAFLATCSTGHFLEAMRMLANDIKHKKDDDCMNDFDSLVDKTDEYLKQETANELIKNAFPSKKGFEEYKKLETQDKYCKKNPKDCDNEIVLKNIQDPKVKDYMRVTAQRRSRIIRELLRDIRKDRTSSRFRHSDQDKYDYDYDYDYDDNDDDDEDDEDDYYMGRFDYDKFEDLVTQEEFQYRDHNIFLREDENEFEGGVGRVGFETPVFVSAAVLISVLFF